MEDHDNYELTDVEAERLAELEDIITNNFQGFYAVGCALAEISASKLYRLTHDTFEDYCRERFEVARRTAYQYIEAKEVMDNVRHGAQTKSFPLNERQVRPLTKLSPGDQIQAWEKAVATAPQGESGAIVTAKHVSHVVSEMLGDMLTKRAEAVKKAVEHPAVAQEFMDALWALIEIVRIEAAKPLPAKIRENMIESIHRVQQLLVLVK